MNLRQFPKAAYGSESDQGSLKRRGGSLEVLQVRTDNTVGIDGESCESCLLANYRSERIKDRGLKAFHFIDDL
jgi:hypothetical protein